MKKLLAIATVLTLAISGSALATTAVKSDQTSHTVKTQHNSKAHNTGKIKNMTAEKSTKV